MKKKSINFIHFDVIDSTNTWAKQHAHQLDGQVVTCITAEEQTKGRGRLNRKWISPKNNIYATLFFCLPKNCPFLSNLAQLFSISVAAVLERKGFSPTIKWPNDLLLQGKKVAGILCEVIQLEDRLGIALGLGLNLHLTQEDLASIEQPAISLSQLSSQTWSVEQILEPIINEFLQDLELLKKDGFAAFQKKYEACLVKTGKWEGVFEAVNEDGSLTIIHPTHGRKVIRSEAEIGE